MSLSRVGPAPESAVAGGPGGPGRSFPPATAGSNRPQWTPARRVVREIGLSLITAGAVVLLFVAYELFGTNVAEANSQSKLKHQFNDVVVPAASPVPASPVPATPGPTTPAPTTIPAPSVPGTQAVAHLVIPKLGVDKFVVEGVGLADLHKGPGHYPQTPMPGEKGNAAIAGHRTTYGAPFYRLNELKPGDDIYITTRQGKFHYTVSETKIVSPNAVSVLDPTPDNRLTLTTCNPRFSAAQRLVVISHLDDPPAPPPVPVISGQVAAGAPVSQGQLSLGAGDSSAWPPTLFFGILTLMLWVGVRLAGARLPRGRWLPYLVGIPVCLVPLWFLFENVIRLLPANI